VRYAEWVARAQDKQGRISIQQTSHHRFYGNLPPMATAAERMELERCQNNETGDCVNYARERQDCEFLCLIQIGNAKPLSVFEYLLVLTLLYNPKEVSEKGIKKKNPAPNCRYGNPQ
jgi:hypothetical protein